MVKKVLIIISIVLALCAPSFSQDARRASDIWYIIDDFTGMLQSHVSPFLTEKNAAQQALNVRVNEQYGSLTKRSPMFLLTTAPTAAVKSIFRHYKSDGTKHTIGTYGTNVSVFDSSGTETILYATATTAKRWSFLTYKDLLIGMDGTDNAKKWDGSIAVTANTDGSRTANDLVADLGAPFAELNIGANLDAASWYQYRVAYYDGTTYKFSLARSNPILTGTIPFELLANLNGSDAATSYTAETGQSFSFFGNAELDTAQKKFGTASLLMDGTGDYTTVPDSTDWDFGTGDFTVDFWVRFNDKTGNQIFFGQYPDGDNNWRLIKNSSGTISMIFLIGASAKGSYTTSSAPTINNDTWYHFAFARNGTTGLIFLGGTSLALTETTAFGTNDTGTRASVLYVGTDDSSGSFLNGWMDSARITKGTALWTADFAPPESEYSIVNDITLTDIPLGPDGTTTRYVYRTVGNSSRVNVLADNTLYLIATISDNSTRTIDDAMTDDDADDDAVPVWSTVAAGLEATPPKSRFSLINTERLFTANDPSGTISGKSTVYWSVPLNPDYFLIGTDFELIRPDDGDEVTFIKNIYGILTIGKTRTISKFYTTATSSADWTVSDPFPYAGCIAPYSAVSTGAGVVFLGRYGIFSFNGQNTKLISDVVTDHIRDILDTNIEDVVGIYHDNRYLMAYTSETTGASKNDRVLILDVVRNAYYLDTKAIDSFTNFDSGDDFGTLYSGSSGSDGNIYAHENSFSRLIYRYKSQLDSGTVSSTYIGGTEEIPFITLGSDEAWEDSTDNWEDSGSKTWMIGSLTGTWISPISQINASELDKLFWNETLGSTGDTTFAIRLASTSSGIAGASWSSEFSDPTGSDISGETANNFIQFRASLSSGLFTETPFVFFSDNFVIRMTYKKDGTLGESSILAVLETGKSGLGGLDLPKRLKEFNIFYEGTAGIMTFQFDNGQGDSYSFDIDLSVDPTSSTTDQYFGTASEKIYVHIPPFDNVPTGRFWTFKISEDSVNVWRVNRIAIKLDINDHTTYK